MMNSTEKLLDQKTLIEIMLQVYEKGQNTATMGPKELVQDIVDRVRPFLTIDSKGKAHDQQIT